MEGLIHFHNYIMIFLITIGVFTVWMLYQVISNFNATIHPVSVKFTHSTVLEIVWTIIPALILMVIAVPSFGLLYSLDELIDPTLTLKIVGHQWYWSYEYSQNISYDSFLVDIDDLSFGDFRNLTVDNYLVLPVNTSIRLLVSSNDVIHSFAVPSLGIKADCLPGRLNSLGFVINRESYFYGGCSELCGSLHHGMPIGIKAKTKKLD
jgi:cytochrome c oxidase subunit 2